MDFFFSAFSEIGRLERNIPGGAQLEATEDDRTCHTGLDRMVMVAQACTLCHSGRGRPLQDHG
jgi:hypothetical protein